MNLHNRGSMHPSFKAHGGSAVAPFITCEVRLVDMNMGQDGANSTGVDYDWGSNGGGYAEPTTLWSGAAQLQVYRFTLTMDAPAGSVDLVRSARFLIQSQELEGIDVRAGQRMVVVECEDDPSLQTYQYIVASGFNAPLAFTRAIECEVDMSRVIRP